MLENIDFYAGSRRMKTTAFHCGSIRQWRKNGVEKIYGLQSKKATTTQEKMNDKRHDQSRSCLLFFVMKIQFCDKLQQITYER